MNMFSGFYHSLSVRLGGGTEDGDFSQQDSESLRLKRASTNATSQLQDTRLTTAGFTSFICHVAHREEDLRRGENSHFFDGNELQITSRSPAGAGGFFIVDRARVADSSVAQGKQFVAIKTPRDQTK